MKSVCLSLLPCAMICTGCLFPSGPPLETVDSVNIESYVGKWYEIAKYPNFFQQGCVGATAEYALRDDGRVKVLNTCFEDTLDGDIRTIEGTARVVDSETNARLKVSFGFPFEGDYWIINLDQDYQWAVVGEPSRNFLWILSRTPQLDDTTYDTIVSGLAELGYEASRLELTPQPADDP